MGITYVIKVIFQVLLSILVPITLTLRIRKNKTGAILNPLFYLLAFSYLYLLIPNFYIDYVIYDVYKLDISREAFELSNVICRWHVLIFWLYYMLSKDTYPGLTDNVPYKGVYQLSLLLYITLTILFLFVLVKYAPAIWTLRGNRDAALQQYHSTIQSPFKISILLHVMFGVTALLVWKNRNLYYLLPLMLPCAIDFSHGGRTVTFMVFIFSYINIVVYRKQLLLKWAAIGSVFMIMVGLIQRSEFSNWVWSLYMAGAEFSNTRVTTAFVIDTNEILSGSLLKHFGIAVFKILPGGISNKIFSIPDGMWYGEEISQHLGLGFGLAGNIATEAYFYGGLPFAIISPIIIGGIYFLINYMKLFKTVAGFVFVLLLCAKTQDIMRMYFYDNFFHLLQIMIFFLPFITFLECRKRIIQTSKLIK